MTDPQKKPLLGEFAFVGSQPVAVQVPNGAEKVTLFVRELSYAESQGLYAEAARAKSVNPFSHLVAASVQDKDGNRFTVDEVLQLKKEVAEPLFKQVLKFQGVDVDSPATAEGDAPSPK